jgi:serine/threonine protein phosphatase 1
MLRQLRQLLGFEPGDAPMRQEVPAGAPDPTAFRWSLPEGALVYAIGDIHGRFDLLKKLLHTIEADRAIEWGVRETYVVFLGDYVDRGFQSREVIECLLSYKSAGITPVVLRGNHEDLMLQFLDDPMVGDLWLRVGGEATLVSYGVDLYGPAIGGDVLAASEAFARALPPEHRHFLENLPVSWQLGDYLFVHAGIRPGVPLEAQRKRDMTTIRQDFTLSGENFGVCVVHGHSGVRQASHCGNRIAVDTGAFATGVLSAAVLHDREVRFLSTA